MPSRRPRVAVFMLGGTIASVTDDTGTHGVSPRLQAAELLESIGGHEEIAELETFSFRQMPSSELTLEDVLELRVAIHEQFASGCVGAVVVQGTDALEEVAFALDVLNDARGTIVVTGAIRNPTVAGADGPANLLGAIRTAASAECRGIGVLVVFSDEIHSARYVRKTHTASLSTFRSLTTGPLGWIGEAGPQIAFRPARRRWLSFASLGEIPPVALVTSGLGDDGRLLAVVPDCGYGGLVVEALGGGHLPAALADRLEVIAASMPVVLTSRAGAGEILRGTYGFPGSERDLLARGLIWPGFLDGAKARVLLALALAADVDREGVAHAFRAIGSVADDLPDGLIQLHTGRRPAQRRTPKGW